jgi:hypothetical protein
MNKLTIFLISLGILTIFSIIFELNKYIPITLACLMFIISLIISIKKDTKLQKGEQNE